MLNHELEGTTTLLTTSFSSSDPAIPDFLLDNGADPNLGTVAIMEEVRTGTADVLGVLIDAGADVNDNGGREGVELLHLAIRDGKADVVRLLVEKKIDLARVNE